MEKDYRNTGTPKRVSSIIIIAIAAIILLIFLIPLAFIGFKNTKYDPSIYSCIEDSDCQKVSATCCQCASGGYQISINKNSSAEYMKKLKNSCSNTSSCELTIPVSESCLGVPACLNNKCKISYSESALNPEKCKNSSDPSQCYTDFAFYYNDTKYCLEIGNFTKRQGSDIICVILIAVANNDDTICFNLMNETSQSVCRSTFSIKKYDFNGCNRLENRNKDNCIKAILIQISKNTKENCVKIGKSNQQECKTYLIDECLQISNSTEQTKCQDQISSSFKI